MVYSLNLSVGDGGYVDLTPEGGCYEAGTVVTLKAVPNQGCVVDSWEGDASGSKRTITVTMDGPKSISITFKVIDFGF